MASDPSGAAQPATPIIVFDDEDVMLTFSSSHEAELAIEWPFVDEIAAGFDGLARPLVVAAIGESVVIYVSGTQPNLPELIAHVETYFRSWTETLPPGRLLRTPDYIAEAIRLQATARLRRRKRKKGDGF